MFCKSRYRWVLTLNSLKKLKKMKCCGRFKCLRNTDHATPSSSSAVLGKSSWGDDVSTALSVQPAAAGACGEGSSPSWAAALPGWALQSRARETSGAAAVPQLRGVSSTTHIPAVNICQEIRNNVSWEQVLLLRAPGVLARGLSGGVFIPNSWLLKLFVSPGGSWSLVCRSSPVGKTASQGFLLLQAAQER